MCANEIDACLLTFDRQRSGASERRGQMLRAAHPAKTSGQDPALPPIAAKVLAARPAKSRKFLNDALAPI